MKKRLCVLEQSGTINDPFTQRKKELFQTENCDYFRLNWKHPDDPHACITAPGVLWSEGRSLLYHHAPKNYDYYMFMDDDITFHYDADIPLDVYIIKLLDEYNPISASFYCNFLWGKNPITKVMAREKKAYPFLCLDLQLTIYSQQFADIIFPVAFHGSDKCMWYAYWIANKLCPGKQICFSDIEIKNTRSIPHNNQEVRKYKDRLVEMFNQLTKDKSFIWDHDFCKQENLRLHQEECNKDQSNIDYSHIHSIYNSNSVYMKLRSPKRNLFHKLIINRLLSK